MSKIERTLTNLTMRDGIMEKVKFYRETEFKETEIGRIPKEWKIVRLGSLTEIIMGQSPPSTSYNNETGIPFLQGKAEFGRINPKHAKFTTSPIKIAPKGSILLSVRAPVGDVNIADIDYCIGRGLACLVPKKILKDFLFYLFQKMKSELENQSGGSTFKSVTRNVLRNFRIPFPPFSEQKAIAKVLKDFDELIEVIDKQIENFERIKKGLMQELLTKGIGHKEFKDTEIGRIPKEWEVKRLGGETCEINPNYKIQRGKVYKFVPMEAVNEDFYKVKFYTEREWTGSGVKFSYGDVLLARITPSAENGKTTVIDFLNKDEYGIGSTEFIVFKPNRAIPLFIYYILKWNKVRNQLINQMTGTTGRQRIPISAPNRIKIPLPPLGEQKKITEILSKWDKVIELKKAKKEKLERMKKKVMELLLTGKVRIR